MIVRWDGRNLSLRFANSMGLAAFAQRRKQVLADALMSLKQPGPGSPFKTSELDINGITRHWLLVERNPKRDPSTYFNEARQHFGLTRRQAEVLVLLAKGLPNKSIADELGCTGATVEQHVTAVLAKLGASTRSEAAVRFWSELAR